MKAWKIVVGVGFESGVLQFWFCLKFQHVPQFYLYFVPHFQSKRKYKNVLKKRKNKDPDELKKTHT